MLAAWAVELGASPLLLGVLWGLPYFGQILQAPALWITARFGRKPACVVLHAIARTITLPIAVVPFVDLSLDVKRAIVVGLFALSSLLAVLGHNAWLAWMGELVPAKVRGVYFGRRAALSAVVATVTSLVIGASLDTGKMHASLGVVLAAIAVLRTVAGVFTTVLMVKQHDPPAPVATPKISDFALPILDRSFRRLLAFRAAWGVATGLAASLSAVFMIKALGLGFASVAMYAAAVAVLRLVTNPLWGKTLDRAGGRRVLTMCTLGAAVSSIAWLFVTHASAWLIAVDAIVSGLLIGGQELAMFTIPLASAPSARRPLYAATSVMASGVAYGAASVAAGALADVVPLRTVLLAAVVWRFVAAVLATTLRDRPATRSARAV